MKVKNYYTERTVFKYISYLYYNGKYKEAYMKECFQNEKDCLAAVKLDSYALIFVKNQTLEMCLAAANHDVNSYYYIHDHKLRNQIKKEFNL